MYVTDFRHFLNAQGAIGLPKGPGLRFANFLATLVVVATDHAAKDATTCFKCKSPQVHAAIDNERRVAWKCLACNECGVISNWQETLWDVTDTAYQQPM